MFKYRAKSLSEANTGKFIYGNKVRLLPVSESDEFPIGIQELTDKGKMTGMVYKVDPSTLGVSWGRKDKNGKDVFTGHWLKVKTQRSQEYGPDKPYEAIMQVVWRPEFESFCLETKEDQDAIKSGSNHYKYAFDPEYRDNDRVYFTSQVEDYEIEIIEED